MDLAGLLLFSSALFIAAASPGPGIAAIVARVLGRGPKEAVAFSIGVALGDVVWLTFAILGLAALAQAFHQVFLVIKYAGAAYLLYIAYKIWTATAVAKDVTAEAGTEHPAKLLLGGLALTLGNPKTIVFYLALLPTILDLTRISAGLCGTGGGHLERAGRGLCRLYCARRPRPAAFHDPKGYPDPQPHYGCPAGRRGSGRCVALKSGVLRPGPPRQPDSAIFGGFSAPFHARVGAWG
jgi:threonine/homoserine/homoserine lactone efflux protein